MLVTREPIRREVPHEEGAWIDICRLSWLQIKKAREAATLANVETMKAAAQSGEYGSQYLLLPNNEKKIDGDLLTYPLSGVTYVEVQNAADIDLVIEQTGNSGILVIHRDNGDSHISSIKADKDSDGLLTGLLITDVSFHHHIDILGAVLMLSTDLETDKSCSGNADHWVYYSSESVVSATHIAAEITGLSQQVGYGFGKKRVKVRYVYE